MAALSSEAASRAGGEARVLVVEDDAIVARDVERSLGGLGHRVVGRSRSGEEALQQARTERPDLVLMDIRLAGELDGIDAGGAIQGELDIPVVYLTAYTDPETRRRVRETEPFGYVVKPFDQRDLHAAVEVALDRHRLERRLRAARNRYEALLRCMGDGLIATDDEGRIEYMNPAAGELTGWSVEEAEGIAAHEVFHLRGEGSGPTASDPVTRALREERVVELDGAEELVARDGGAVPVAGSVAPVEAAGRIVGAEAVFRDLSEIREAERNQAATERRYRVLFEQNVAGVFRATLEGEILEVNAALARMFGFDDPSELEGLSVGETLCSGSKDWGALRRQLVRDGRIRNREVQACRPDGSRIWVLASAAVIEERPGGEELIVGTAVEITSRKDMEEELAELAYHDELTGLANRRMLAEKAEQVLALSDRGEGQAALLYLDLDGFKAVNDRFGHRVGDEVLGRVAGRLADCAREADTVARVGGDEFAILLSGVEDARDAVVAAERFTRQLEEPVSVEGHSLRVEGCCGVALYPEHGETFEKLVRAADQAMYASKRADREAVELAGAVETPGVVHGPAPVGEEEVRRSLGDRLLVLYQPVCRVEDGARVGAEALARWRQPDGRKLAGADLVPVIERAGLGERLDARVLTGAARRLDRWSGDGAPDWVAVNFTIATFCSPRLLGRLEELVDRHRLDPGRLVVEVSDRSAARYPGSLEERIVRLRELGIRIALDDFVGDPAGMARVRELAPDFLKLDRSYLARPDDADRGAELTRDILRLGEEVGLQVVLEGVETAEQVARARERGIELVQGWYTGPPSPAEALA